MKRSQKPESTINDNILDSSYTIIRIRTRSHVFEIVRKMTFLKLRYSGNLQKVDNFCIYVYRTNNENELTFVATWPDAISFLSML